MPIEKGNNAYQGCWNLPRSGEARLKGTKDRNLKQKPLFSSNFGEISAKVGGAVAPLPHSVPTALTILAHSVPTALPIINSSKKTSLANLTKCSQTFFIYLFRGAGTGGAGGAIAPPTFARLNLKVCVYHY